jgi:hypothetical protein
MTPPLDPPGESPLPAPRAAAAVGPRRTGRRAALGIYWVIVVAVCLAGAVQITLQVFFAPFDPSHPLRSATCHEGLRALFNAVERARAEAAGTPGEDAALDRYRRALQPEWGYRDRVANACRGSTDDEGALDAIERLRYAEEHAVRREAGELAPLRRRVRAIVDGPLAPSPAKAP